MRVKGIKCRAKRNQSTAEKNAQQMKRLKTTNKNKTATTKKSYPYIAEGKLRNERTTRTQINKTQETDLLLMKKKKEAVNVFYMPGHKNPFFSIAFHFYIFNFCSIDIIRYWTESKNYYLEYNSERIHTRKKKQSRKLIIFIFQRGRHVWWQSEWMKKTLPQMERNEWDSMKTTAATESCRWNEHACTPIYSNSVIVHYVNDGFT